MIQIGIYLILILITFVYTVFYMNRALKTKEWIEFEKSLNEFKIQIKKEIDKTLKTLKVKK